MDGRVRRAAGCAAWIHGRAARARRRASRGTTLEQVLEMLPNAWRIPDDQPRYPVIAELPAVAHTGVSAAGALKDEKMSRIRRSESLNCTTQRVIPIILIIGSSFKTPWPRPQSMKTA